MSQKPKPKLKPKRRLVVGEQVRVIDPTCCLAGFTDKVGKYLGWDHPENAHRVEAVDAGAETDTDIRENGWYACSDCIETIDPAAPATPGGALKFSDSKPQPTLVSARFIESVARALEFGASKYGRDNYRKEPRLSRAALLDAALRHIGADVDDPEALDPESGLPHLWHAAASLAMLLDNPAESPDPKTTKPNPPPEPTP